MRSQTVKFTSDPDNPFEEKTVQINVPKGVKILSTEDYAIDMMSMYESSFEDIDSHTEKITDGSIVEAAVSKIVGHEAMLDLVNETAFINLLKEKEEHLEYLQPGHIVKVKVTRKKSGKNVYLEAKFGEVLEIEKQREILDSIGENVGYWGTVKEFVNESGYVVDIEGVETFMPGSLAGINKLWDFNAIVGEKIVVVPINFSKEKGTVVVSHREYLKTLIPAAIEALSQNLSEQVQGKVTGTTKYGVFAEFNECLTGMIPYDELVDSLDSFKIGGIKPGDDISFWVKQIIHENKIILTQKGEVVDPWLTVEERYSPGKVVKAKVKRKVGYGVFIELEEGLSGLLHNNDMKGNVYQKGEVAEVKIVKIDAVNRKIVFSGL